MFSLQQFVLLTIQSLHSFPSCGHSQTDEDSPEDDERIPYCKNEDIDMSNLEGDDDVFARGSSSFEDCESKRDETENHELAIDDVDDGGEVAVATTDPVLQGVKQDLSEEGASGENDDHPFRARGGYLEADVSRGQDRG